MENNEKEINLKRLLYKALKHWRVAVLTALVGAVVVGGTKCTVELVQVSQPEVVEERHIKYEGELALYQQEGDIIRKDMEALETSIQQQTEYNANSLLMEIDPYNEWVGSVDFYVETDWQVLPELSVQAQNPANQIVRVYNAYITNGELYRYINDRLTQPMEIRFLREVLSASADATNYLIHFSVRGASEADCEELLTLIEEGMRAKQSEIESSVGEYELQTTNRSAYSRVNYDLEQMQKDNRQAIEDATTALSAKKFEQLEWEKKEEDIEKPVMGKRSAVVSGIKWAFITGCILLFGILGGFGLGYIVSRYVQDREDFEDWGVYVAELPQPQNPEKRHRFEKLDRLIGRIFLGNIYRRESAEYLKVATKQIAEMAKLSFDAEKPKLVLVGEVEEGGIARYSELMSSDTVQTDVCFIAGGNLLRDHTVVEKVREAEGVVLVVRQNCTKRESVHRMRQMLAELNKQPMAVLLTYADAID